MCRTTIPCFLAYHKSLFLRTRCNLFPSAPTLQANKVIYVEVYCEQIATAKSTNSLSNGLSVVFRRGRTNKATVVVL